LFSFISYHSFSILGKYFEFLGPLGFNFQTWDQRTLSSSKGALQCTYLERFLYYSALSLRLGCAERKTQFHSVVFTQKFFCFLQEMDPNLPYGCIFRYSLDQNDNYMERMRAQRTRYVFPK